jgi:hypothetical protein
MHESTDHLLTKYNYTEAVWNLIALRLHLRDCNFMGHLGGPRD